jgi:hypothetical protein
MLASCLHHVLKVLGSRHTRHFDTKFALKDVLTIRQFSHQFQWLK